VTGTSEILVPVAWHTRQFTCASWLAPATGTRKLVSVYGFTYLLTQHYLQSNYTQWEKERVPVMKYDKKQCYLCTAGSIFTIYMPFLYTLMTDNAEHECHTLFVGSVRTWSVPTSSFSSVYTRAITRMSVGDKLRKSPVFRANSVTDKFFHRFQLKNQQYPLLCQPESTYETPMIKWSWGIKKIFTVNRHNDNLHLGLSTFVLSPTTSTTTLHPSPQNSSLSLILCKATPP